MNNAEMSAQRVRQSVASTASERDLAQHLLAVTAAGDPDQAEAALQQLRALEAALLVREQGRALPIIPAEAQDPTSVLAGLAYITDGVLVELDTQIEGAASSRRTWLLLAMLTATLATLAGMGPLLAFFLNGEADPLPQVELLLIAVASPLVLTVLSMRVYQARDGTVRRLQEKRVSVKFLDSAVELNRREPEARNLLERSFNMFAAHQETTDAPITVSDLLGGQP